MYLSPCTLAQMYFLLIYAVFHSPSHYLNILFIISCTIPSLFTLLPINQRFRNARVAVRCGTGEPTSSIDTNFSATTKIEQLEPREFIVFFFIYNFILLLLFVLLLWQNVWHKLSTAFLSKYFVPFNVFHNFFFAPSDFKHNS